MKKSLVTISLAIAAFSCTFSCKEGGGNEPSLENSRPEGLNAKYTCSMHPEVISDASGRCPKCGMDLVEKRTSSEAREGEIPADNVTPAETGQNVGAKTESTDSTTSTPSNTPGK